LQKKKSAVSSRHEPRKYEQQAAVDPIREPTADELAVTEEANDSAQLLPAVDRLEEQRKKKLQQIVIKRQ
jgi:hypothetical protein